MMQISNQTVINAMMVCILGLVKILSVCIRIPILLWVNNKDYVYEAMTVCALN